MKKIISVILLVVTVLSTSSVFADKGKPLRFRGDMNKYFNARFHSQSDKVTMLTAEEFTEAMKEKEKEKELVLLTTATGFARKATSDYIAFTENGQYYVTRKYELKANNFFKKNKNIETNNWHKVSYKEIFADVYDTENWYE